MRIYFILVSVLVFAVLGLLYSFEFSISPFIPGIAVILFLMGVMDMLQRTHAVRRNFPVIGNLRYLLEAIRPEIQQYFVESNTDGRPINRNVRSVVYQRSKKALRVQPFGTQLDLYKEGEEWVCHSLFGKPLDEKFSRVWVGSRQCSKPYEASVFNISAMSYGSLSRKAVEALNRGAAMGGFYHNTGEGGIADHHLMGGDLVYQIGTGYFGCRAIDGRFSPDEYRKRAHLESVKMIELKLSQGAKPGKGGLLPGAKVNDEIARVRGVEIGKDVVSPAFHKEFSDTDGLLKFIKNLRDEAQGKPVGFKLCLGKKDDFTAIVKSIEKTGITPDFITVDGAEGGTGAAPSEFSDYIGMPLKDGLSFVVKTLDQAGLTEEIKVIASGKAMTAFDLIRNFAMGANIVNSARGMMLALGCIQALRCHSNHCPVGITTSREDLMAGLDVKQKSQRVFNYHDETIKVLGEMLQSMGKASPQELSLGDIFQRQSDGTYKTFAEIYA